MNSSPEATLPPAGTRGGSRDSCLCVVTSHQHHDLCSQGKPGEICSLGPCKKWPLLLWPGHEEAGGGLDGRVCCVCVAISIYVCPSQYLISIPHSHNFSLMYTAMPVRECTKCTWRKDDEVVLWVNWPRAFVLLFNPKAWCKAPLRFCLAILSLPPFLRFPIKQASPQKAGRLMLTNKSPPYLLKKYPRKKLNQAKSRFQVFYRIVN